MVASQPGDGVLSGWGVGCGERSLRGCTCREGQADPTSPGPPGGVLHCSVGKLIYSHANIRERNADTFPVKNNQVHFWALPGVVKTLLSTIVYEAEKL